MILIFGDEAQWSAMTPESTATTPRSGPGAEIRPLVDHG
jgi:hypothetical protein